ncbi:ABC transporter permease (plasmid) [Haloferax larsenii]|uniref:ABC transporter permease n=1 Tax=Haloferax larsenii TaxID=302484 RepID=A0ABY5RL06_HALLR|nr:ABC transporter permease [Haloferax larsenii]UVE52215.1 ABC transporter permease [Haloferax larsenii]
MSATAIRAVVRRDLRRMVQNKVVWGAVLLLAAVYLPSVRPPSGSSPPIEVFLNRAGYDLVTYTVPVSVAIGYNAIVGDRTQGRLRTLFGLPLTRHDVFLGKALSRVILTAVPVVVVLLVTQYIVFDVYGTLHVVPFWVMGGWILAYAMSWTAVAVALSARVSSRYTALVALFGVYLFLSPKFGVWVSVVEPFVSQTLTSSAEALTYDTLAQAPWWRQSLTLLNPLTACWRLLQSSVAAATTGQSLLPLPLLAFALASFLGFVTLPLRRSLTRFCRTDLTVDPDAIDLATRLRRRLPSGSGGGCVLRSLSGISDSDRTGESPLSRIYLVASRDGRHAVRDGPVLTGTLVLLVFTASTVWTTTEPSSITPVVAQVTFVSDRLTTTAFLFGALVGHRAIAAERQSGQLRTLLGKPLTRDELLLAKASSRVLLAVGTILTCSILAKLIFVFQLGEVRFAAFTAWTLVAVIGVIVVTCLALSVSAITRSTYRAIAGTLGTFVIFTQVWKSLVTPAIEATVAGESMAVVAERSAGVSLPLALNHLSPFVALDTIEHALLPSSGGSSVPPGVLLYSVGIVVLVSVTALHVGRVQFVETDL